MPPTTAGTSTFFYTARKQPGNRTAYGFRTAKSRAALQEQLKREKLVLKTARPVPVLKSGPARLKPSDHLILNEQLHQLLSRGVPLVEALEVAAETVRPPARPLIEKMRDLVAAGASFSDGCQKVGSFDSVSVAVYRAAERSGDLSGAAKQIAVTLRRTLAVTGRAVTLMIYPAIVLSISLLVAFGMMTTVVPRLAEALEGAQDLPLISKVVMGTGKFMAANVLLILLAVLAGVVAVYIFRGPIGEAVMRTARRTPLIREVIMAQESVRFFSTMAGMTRSGVPLADALGVANGAISHPKLKREMERLRTRLIEGGALRTLIDEVESFPLATRKLLIAAEKSGDLESAFNTLALDMTEEVERRSQRFLAVLQPALIVVMFLIIGSLLAALLLPMINMSSTLAR